MWQHVAMGVWTVVENTLGIRTTLCGMRYVVIGTSGVGKSTFAKALAAYTHAAYIELDHLHWAPDWTERPDTEFSAAVASATETERWVVDGNYSVVRSIVWPRATHVIWLNFSRSVVFTRIIRRTVRRAALREKLWHGNQESFRRSFLSKDSIILWSLTTYQKNQLKYAALRDSGHFGHLHWHEIQTPAEAARFLSNVGRADA